MGTQKLDFKKNFTANAEIADLVKIGWTFDFKNQNNEDYHIEITVDEEGKTFWRVANSQRLAEGINEGSDNEATGDDQQTVEDLKTLYQQDKLWGEKNYL